MFISIFCYTSFIPIVGDSEHIGDILPEPKSKDFFTISRVFEGV